MDNKNKNQDFTLDDIIREFGSDWINEELHKADKSAEETFIPHADAPTQPEDVSEEMPAEVQTEAEQPSEEIQEVPAEAEVSAEETRVLPELPQEEPEVQEELPEQTDPQEEIPEQEELPQQEPPVLPQEEAPVSRPILFRSKLGELKHKLVSGPEKRYYDLTEVGLGRVQIAIFLSLLIVALCAGGSAMYAMGMVMENRLRLMIFSQILAMMVSALLGCYVLMDGIVDLFTGKFSLNTMLFLTLAACAADAVFCLQELRVPCCAAFSLEMTFALWNRSLRRSTEMGQMDTLRKANRLDGIVKVEDQMGNGPAIVRTEGRVEDFMDHYNATSAPEKSLHLYALLSILACIGIAVLAGVRHSLSLGIQVFSTSMLVAVPASAFVSQSRPAAILERRLHMVGTVLCGWQGVQSLCGKASFPLHDRDIFPLGSMKLNGVKFLGGWEPDEVIAFAAALLQERGGGLEPLFTQLLKNRGGACYMAEDLQVFNGGIGGVVRGESCVLGLCDCLREQGVDIPDSALVDNAVYFSVGGVLTAVFALNYSRTKASAGGLVTLGGCRDLRPLVLCRNFTITPQLLKEKFGIRTKRYDFPDQQVRDELAEFTPDPELIAGALTCQQNLSSIAYAATGARALRTSCRLGRSLHIFAGLVGLLIMAALAYIGDMQLLSPFNILLYQLVWVLPGLLLTEWARTV